MDVFPEHDFFAPLQIFPEPDTDLADNEVVLHWHSSEGADGYDLQIAADSAFSVTVLEETMVTDTSFVVTLEPDQQYYWRVRSVHDGEWAEWSPRHTFTTEAEVITSADAERPPAWDLEQNYPNPFNPSTVIRYQLATETEVRLEIYDLLGRQVATLVDRQQEAGRHAVPFDAGGLASGTYIYRLQAGEHQQTRQMMLVR